MICDWGPGAGGQGPGLCGSLRSPVHFWSGADVENKGVDWVDWESQIRSQEGEARNDSPSHTPLESMNLALVL